MSLEIVPTGAALGAQIRGVDLSQPPGDNVFAEIEHAYDAHGVVFFRDQRITPAQQVAFTRRFGQTLHAGTHRALDAKPQAMLGFGKDLAQVQARRVPRGCALR